MFELKGKISRKFDNAISFLSGIIFYNAIITFLDGQWLIAIFSLISVFVALKIKHIFDLTLRE